MYTIGPSKIFFKKQSFKQKTQEQGTTDLMAKCQKLASSRKAKEKEDSFVGFRLEETEETANSWAWRMQQTGWVYVIQKIETGQTWASRHMEHDAQWRQVDLQQNPEILPGSCVGGIAALPILEKKPFHCQVGPAVPKADLWLENFDRSPGLMACKYYGVRF